MKIDSLRAALFQKCEHYVLSEDIAAVIQEPYVPYVPAPLFAVIFTIGIKPDRRNVPRG